MKTIKLLLIAASIIGLSACKANTETTNNVEKKATAIDNACVVYVSLSFGNTRGVAETIAETVKGKLLEVKPAVAYTEADLDYKDPESRSSKEHADPSIRPEIASDLSAVNSCDNVFIGYPIWWGTMPNIFRGFLEKYDITKKNVYLFSTAATTGNAQTVEDLKGMGITLKAEKRFINAPKKEEVVEWVNGL